jgi:hypothetical protein
MMDREKVRSNVIRSKSPTATGADQKRGLLLISPALGVAQKFGRSGPPRGLSRSSR